MARIPLFSLETCTPEQRRIYEKIVSGPRGALVGPLRAALHSPELADRWQRLGEFLRFGTCLPPRLNELAILVTARRWNAQLEWQIHADAARRAGLSEAVIEAIRVAAPPLFADADEGMIYDYCRELQQFGQVGDAAYGAVRERFGVAGVVELTALAGYYTMVAMTLNAHHIELERTPELDSPGRLTDLPPGASGIAPTENKL